MKIIEAHAHIEWNEDVDKTVSGFQDMMNGLGYENVHILTVNHFVKEKIGDITRNLKGLYVKDHLGLYASHGLFHRFDGTDTRKGFGEQIKHAYKMGFDGFKMLEGKPGFHRKTGKAVDDPIYWDLYEFAEEKGLPVVLHSADPPHYWEYEKLSEYQKNAGWFCDSSLPTKDDFRKAIWGIMENFPKLKLTLAHMGFLHEHPEHLCEFFDRWENTAIDLTPNDYEMGDMEKDLPYWRKFFSKYRDRIYYGTDAYPFDLEGKTYAERFPRVTRLRSFLENEESAFDFHFLHVRRGLALPEDILEDIYYKNHDRRYGAPRPLDRECIAAECKNILENCPYPLSALDVENLQKMHAYFQKKIKE